MVYASRVSLPDVECASTGRFPIEVMSSVLDDQPEVKSAGKVDGQLNLRNGGHIHRVWRVRSQRAIRGISLGPDSRRKAGRVLIQFCIDGSGIIGSGGMVC